VRKFLRTEQEDGDDPDEQDFLERQTKHSIRITPGEASLDHARRGRSLDVPTYWSCAVSDIELNWKFSDDFVVETDALVKARQQSLELGIDAIAPSVGAQSAVLAAATGARSILEVGTGAGVSGIWLLTGAPGATLTSIDNEIDHQQHARASFVEAGIPANRVRLITGKAAEVLPRLRPVPSGNRP
jgi:hypothetical protein